MPKHYKPIVGHKPAVSVAELDAIEDHLENIRGELKDLFERWKLKKMDFDDWGPFISQIKRRLIEFVLHCDALPLRTPRQLIPTVRVIANDPCAFLENVGRYDPEAAAGVYGAFANRSAQHYSQLEKFEWGSGPAPAAEEIANAAHFFLAQLQEEARLFSRRGGQRLLLQQELARDLRRIFVQAGGRVTRVVRFNLDRTSEENEDGPFHAFLRLVLPPVRPFATRAGFRMTSIRILVINSEGDVD